MSHFSIPCSKDVYETSHNTDVRNSIRLREDFDVDRLRVTRSGRLNATLEKGELSQIELITEAYMTISAMLGVKKRHEIQMAYNQLTIIIEQKRALSILTEYLRLELDRKKLRITKPLTLLINKYNQIISNMKQGGFSTILDGSEDFYSDESYENKFQATIQPLDENIQLLEKWRDTEIESLFHCKLVNNPEIIPVEVLTAAFSKKLYKEHIDIKDKDRPCFAIAQQGSELRYALSGFDEGSDIRKNETCGIIEALIENKLKFRRDKIFRCSNNKHVKYCWNEHTIEAGDIEFVKLTEDKQKRAYRLFSCSERKIWSKCKEGRNLEVFVSQPSCYMCKNAIEMYYKGWNLPIPFGNKQSDAVKYEQQDNELAEEIMQSISELCITN